MITAHDLSLQLFGRVISVTQGYLNPSNVNPTPDRKHAGIDFGASAGTIINAIKGGQILTAGNSYGTVAIFDGKNTILYLHLQKIYTINTDECLLKFQPNRFPLFSAYADCVSI